MIDHNHTLDVGTDTVSGLNTDEVKKRLAEYGYNEVPEKKTNPILQFAAKFWGLTSWMLQFTVIMEWVLGKISRSLRDSSPAYLQRCSELHAGGEGKQRSRSSQAEAYGEDAGPERRSMDPTSS